MGEYVRFKNWAVCQICGRCVMMSQATPKNKWLVSPRRYEPDVIVVRCPNHISEWALRESCAGRTKRWRKIMAEGKKVYFPIPVHLSPFPTSDELPVLPKSWEKLLQEPTQGAIIRRKRRGSQRRKSNETKAQKQGDSKKAADTP